MAARTLNSPPSLLPLYARAAAPLLPGASLLPFVPGGGSKVPEIELLLPAAKADADDVAAYAHVCGFALREHLPPTYPHVLAFPLHMAVMADGRFPFGAIGLVHVENEIVQRRPIAIGEQMSITVRPTALQPHPRGRAFALITEVSVSGEVVWEGRSTMLRRGGGAQPDETGEARGGGEGAGAGAGAGEHGPAEAAREQAAGPGERSAADREDGAAAPGLRPNATWRLPGDLGRRYAAVSGDRNPIHMHPLAARLFGFPRAIAHGMWSKARCLAALESALPYAFTAHVRFRKPILLPAEVQFSSSLAEAAEAGGPSAAGEPSAGAEAAKAGGPQAQIRFALADAESGTPHLEGRVSNERSGR